MEGHRCTTNVIVMVALQYQAVVSYVFIWCLTTFKNYVIVRVLEHTYAPLSLSSYNGMSALTSHRAAQIEYMLLLKIAPGFNIPGLTSILSNILRPRILYFSIHVW